MIRSLRLGLALGVTWALAMFITTLISLGTGYAQLFLDVMQSIYPGFSISVTGSIIGLIYGFIDGWVAGIVIGWLYNLFGSKEN